MYTSNTCCFIKLHAVFENLHCFLIPNNWIDKQLMVCHNINPFSYFEIIMLAYFYSSITTEGSIAHIGRFMYVWRIARKINDSERSNIFFKWWCYMQGALNISRTLSSSTLNPTFKWWCYMQGALNISRTLSSSTLNSTFKWWCYTQGALNISRTLFSSTLNPILKWCTLRGFNDTYCTSSAPLLSVLVVLYLSKCQWSHRKVRVPFCFVNCP